MDLPLEKLELTTMASGNLAIRLTTRVSWKDFPEYAEAVVARLGGVVVDRGDTPVERLWTVTIRGEKFWVTFDDWDGISLEPQDASAGKLVTTLQSELLASASQ